MKKLISLILAIAMVLSMTTLVMADSPKINLTYVPVDDNNFDVIVSLANNPGFIAFSITLEFDKYVVTPYEVLFSEELPRGTELENLEDINRDPEKFNTTTILFYTTQKEDIEGDIDIGTVRFKFKDAIPVDKQSVASVIKVVDNEIDISNSKYEKVAFDSGDIVTVIAPTTEREPEPGEYDLPETVKPEKEENKDISSIVDSMTGGKTEKEYKAEVKNVEEQNKVKYMAMYEDETFKPDAPATRYEVIKALDNLFEITSEEFAPAFADVTEEYKEIVQKFVTAKILNGYEDKTFKGGNTITRAEFVKILAVAFDMKLDETAIADFTDISGHWAENYIKTFVSGGYTKGYAEADGTFTFRPEGNVTRAEVVAFINRIIAADAEASEKLPSDLKNADGSQHWAYDEIVKVVK